MNKSNIQHTFLPTWLLCRLNAVRASFPFSSLSINRLVSFSPNLMSSLHPPHSCLATPAPRYSVLSALNSEFVSYSCADGVKKSCFSACCNKKEKWVRQSIQRIVMKHKIFCKQTILMCICVHLISLTDHNAFQEKRFFKTFKNAYMNMHS